ncbi:helix-turn-helix domain-containing protein [Vibrio cholerae]
MDLDTPTSEPSLCTRHCNDANQQAGQLINWHQEYDQLSEGHFSGMIQERRFRHLHVFREDSNRSLRQQCSIEEGIWLGLSVEANAITVNQRPMNASDILVRDSNSEFELVTPRDYAIYGIVADQSVLDHVLYETDHQGSGLSPALLGITDESSANLLRRYLSVLLNPERHVWSAHTHQRLLCDFISELLSHSSAPTPRVVASQQQRIIQSAIDYVTQAPSHRPITVSDLCQATHVSRRTLQYAFEHYCQVSPKQYIKRVRLNQVRRALQAPLEDGSISDIAFRFGFYHMGEFGRSYRQLFGESPSHTRMNNTRD